MRFWPLILIFAPFYAFGFGVSLDAKTDHGQVMVVHREATKTTLTVFASAPTTRWRVILPTKDTSVRIVPRSALEELEPFTRPVLEHQVEHDPCNPEVAQPSSDVIAPKDPIEAPQLVVPQLISPTVEMALTTDIQNALSEGWQLAELTSPSPDSGIQIAWDSEFAQLPPRLTRDASDPGELTYITLSEKRMEPVNFKNQVVVTNILVDASVDDDALVSSIFAASNTIEKGAFYTEFARSCDSLNPCPQTLVFGGDAKVITRMRRITDLSKFTGPVTLFPTFHLEGGIDGPDGTLRAGGYSADRSNFKMRLIARTPFNGAITCPTPKRNVWKTTQTKAVRGLHDVMSTEESRAALFARSLRQDVPEIFWTEPKAPQDLPQAQTPAPSSSSCKGCSASFALFVFPLFWRRRYIWGESA